MSLAVMIALGAILILAIADLWLGVANDAVNFLNSAIGSRVAKRRTILLVAGFGVLLGALSSSGLMEVARRGVFDPTRFVGPDGVLMVQAILAVYLGVMAADVLLLDLFNTFGLPTSTTVSIISELVGASIAVALWATPGGFWDALTVIRTGPVLGIYTGIFLSVFVAFSVSAFVMFVVRLLFTHDLDRTFRRWGWLWAGLATTSIVYFVLFKGLRGASLLDDATMASLQANIGWVVLGVFVLTALATASFGAAHEKVLGVIILMGTGALGLAFAGNDLVNFIGPAVAASQAVLVEGVDLSGRVPTPPWALVLAGAVMVTALWTSKKARRVTDTEVRLSAREHIEQRFQPNTVSASFLRFVTAILQIVVVAVPETLRRWGRRRLRPTSPVTDAAPYDRLRASVNLTVASLLISMGTASGLPLSTTYITFMAAMGAAVGDRSWTAEDAEQRIAGIFTVLGGWLVTGVIAAMGAFVTASIIALGGTAGTVACLVLVSFGVWRMAPGDEEDEQLEFSGDLMG